MNRIAQFWWRGALGGALGSAALILVLLVIEAIKNDYIAEIIQLRLVFVLLIVGILGSLPGAVVGTLLCCLSIRFDKGFSFVSRILIGTVFTYLLIGSLFYLVSDGPGNNLQGFLTIMLVVALTIGGLAALASPSREGPSPDARTWPGGILR